MSDTMTVVEAEASPIEEALRRVLLMSIKEFHARGIPYQTLARHLTGAAAGCVARLPDPQDRRTLEGRIAQAFPHVVAACERIMAEIEAATATRN